MRGDVASGIALLLLSGATWYHTTTFREVPAALSQNVPPTFFPRLVLVVTAVLASSLVMSGWRKPAAKPEPIARTVLGTAAIYVAAVVLAPRLGFLSTVFVASIALPIYWGERRPARIAALACALPLVVHVVFTVALGMRFPRGLLL